MMERDDNRTGSFRARSARSTFPLFHWRGAAAPSTPRAARAARGFTLVELLVVIAVIAILIGIVAPLVGAMARKARDSRAKDLCSQMVESWTLLAMKNSRLPHADLISSVVDTKKLGDGSDLWFRMTPAAGELLNGWSSPSPIPKADKKNYKPRVEIGKSPSDYPEYKDAVDFPPDRIFERSVMQKRFGVFVPWVERFLQNEANSFGPDSDDSGRLYEVETEKLKDYFVEGGACYHGVICVGLDMDADGKITIPAGTIDNGEDIELRATAVAWVWDEKKEKTIRSW